MNQEITGDTTVRGLADAWLKKLRNERRLENTTINEYERVLSGLVIPELGTIRICALTTKHIDEVLKGLAAESQNINRQRKAKVVTGAMLDEAVKSGAIALNPVRRSMSVKRPKTRAAELRSSEVEAVRAAVQAWMDEKRPGPRATDDMADIIDVMLGTGARIGEVLALRWHDIDLAAKRVQIAATIKTETGLGTYRKPLAVARSLDIPEFTINALRRRQSRSRDVHTDAVFATRNGTWQQVNNVERRWGQIRKAAGLDWVKPEAFRHSAVPEV